MYAFAPRRHLPSLSVCDESSTVDCAIYAGVRTSCPSGMFAGSTTGACSPEKWLCSGAIC